MDPLQGKGIILPRSPVDAGTKGANSPNRSHSGPSIGVSLAVLSDGTGGCTRAATGGPGDRASVGIAEVPSKP